MATNTGIEVTALKPSARAGDYYVRPDQTPSGIEQGLARLAGTMSKKQKEEDKATAENLHISDSLNNANDIHDFTAYAHESAGVVAHLKELRGRSYAHKWRTETENAYKEFAATSDEQGGDYHSFMAERKSVLAESFKGDRFMIAGAMSVMNEADQNMRAVHRQYLDARMRTNTSNELDANVDVHMASFLSGNKTIQTVATDIDDMVQTAHLTGGITNSKGNEQVFNRAVAKYKETGDYNYYRLASQLKFAKGKNGTVNTKAESVLGDAFEHVEYEAQKAQTLSDQQAEKQKKIDIQDAWNTINAKFFDNPNYNVTAEDSRSLTVLGIKQTAINAVRDSYATMNDVTRGQRHVEYAASIRAQINDAMYDPNGVQVTNDTLLASMVYGDIHPSDMASLQASLKSAAQATPLLQGPEIRDYKSTLIERAKKAFAYDDPANAAIIYNLENDFDEAFVEIIKGHYKQDGAMTPSNLELRAYANQAKDTIEMASQLKMDKQNEYLELEASYDALADTSAAQMDYSINDADMEDVEAMFQTVGGKKIKAALELDPLTPIKYKNSDGVVEIIPAHEALDLRIQAMYTIGGYGGYYVYRQYQKENRKGY